MVACNSHLESVITQNIFTKDEVEKMIEAALREFHERTQELSKNFSERTFLLDKRIDLNFKEMENRLDKVDSRIDKVMARYMYGTVGILGALIVVVGAVNTFAHYFLH
jgi:hypothetical protein